MVSLDEALDELGMLSNGSRYKREYIQDIEAAYEKRKAENAKWLNWHTRADIVREEDMERKNIPSLELLAKQQHKHHINFQNTPAVGQTGHTNGKVEFTNLMSACSNQNVIQDPANTSSTSISIQIGAGSPHQPYMMRGVSPMTNPLRGLSCSSSINKDSQFVTNITVKQSQSGFPPYSKLKLERDSYNRRVQFNPRRGCEYRSQYSSPYYHHRVITLPPSISSTQTESSSSLMMNGQYTPSSHTRTKTYPHTSVLKLSGVLTSFKHRTFRTRPRVRFCVREENTDELTAQLSNIKLNTSSFNMNNSNVTSDQSCVTSTITTTTPSSLQVSSRRESTPEEDNLRMAVRNRLLLEPRSRHMSLEPNDPLMRSDLLAISLNHLDLEDETVAH